MSRPWKALVFLMMAAIVGTAGWSEGPRSVPQEEEEDDKAILQDLEIVRELEMLHMLEILQEMEILREMEPATPLEPQREEEGR